MTDLSRAALVHGGWRVQVRCVDSRYPSPAIQSVGIVGVGRDALASRIVASL